MKIERGRKPDFLNQHLESLRLKSATSDWLGTIAEATAVLELTDGKHPEALNHRGKGWRCIKMQSLAVLDFQTAIRQARKSGDLEQEVMAAANLVDAWRTANRDQNFPYSQKYQIQTDKRRYGLQQANRWARKTQLLIKHMPHFTEAKAHALNMMGLLFIEPEIQNFQKALAIYNLTEKSLRDLQIDDPSSYSLKERLARTIHLKGLALEQLGKLPEAEAAQRESLGMSVGMNHVRNIGNAANGLGDVLMKQGYPDKAHHYFKIAYKISEKDGKVIDQEIHDDASRRLTQFPNHSN